MDFEDLSVCIKGEKKKKNAEFEQPVAHVSQENTRNKAYHSTLPELLHEKGVGRTERKLSSPRWLTHAHGIFWKGYTWQMS